MKTKAKAVKRPFYWKHYQGDIILLNVRWYYSYELTYRDLVEMMAERGLNLAHTTIMRWVRQYLPQIDKKIKSNLKEDWDSCRVEETHVKIKGEWAYLYRAVDKDDNTLDFMLSAQQDAKAATRFFKKVMKAKHVQDPRVAMVTKNPVSSVSPKQAKKAVLPAKKSRAKK